MSKMRSTHTMGCYSVLKGMKLICAAECMNLENVMLSDSSQTQRLHVAGFHLPDVPRTDKSVELETKTEAGSRGNVELSFKGYSISVWDDEQIQEMENADGVTAFM